ncbi:heterokaryon incompatibility protein-domain-containing protein [Nemania abortiva]|nr:heterokaryon incompatibility protein-domain-containing protein [Nemania abortiva]
METAKETQKMNDAEGSLCETCIAALKGVGYPRQEIATPHHQSYENFAASRTNCFICAWLWAQHVPPPTPPDDSVSTETFRITCQSLEKRGGRSPTYKASFLVKSSWAAGFELQVGFANGTNKPWFRKVLRKLRAQPWSKIDSRLGSMQDLQTIKTWLSNCEVQHKHCRPQTRTASSFFPTRVIDVKDADSGVVRLQEGEFVSSTSPDKARPAYWTLSHRWGDSELVLQLTKTTEQDFHRAIPMNHLPPTFRDAVLLVHRLGFRYLWVDSLCIYQDSLSDWHRQTHQMIDVYRNSHCNISAVGSSYNPSTKGLFEERRWERRLLYPFLVKEGFQPREENRRDGWVAWNDSMWDNDVQKTPLSTRGWVVQERFLGTRVVHFTQNQIFWECLESIHCGTDPNSTLETIDSNVRHSSITTTQYKSSRLEVERCASTRRLEARDDDTSRRLRREWSAILSVYMSSNLTKDSDRLIALSGIAKIFRELSGDTYVAGLWKKTIDLDLAWRSYASRGIPARRSTSYAPSWSWASIVGGQVRILSLSRRPSSYVTLLEVRVITDPPNGDPAGSLRSAELDIECISYHYRLNMQSKKLTLYGNPKTTGRWPGFEEREIVALYLDTSDLVDRFAGVKEIEGTCITLLVVFRDMKILVEYLMLEHDGNNRYKRIGIVSSTGTSVSMIKGRHTSLTLI